MSKNALAIVSGGLDSAVMLALLLEQGWKCRAVGFNYGQRHRRELQHADLMCTALDVPYEVVDIREAMSALTSSDSALVNPDVAVPRGHYADPTMKATIVPNRNLIMLSLAAGIALSHRLDAIAIGAHRGDHDIYPDCRMEFLHAVERTLALCDDRPLGLLRPLIEIDKKGVVALGIRLGVDFGATWTCYEGGEVACGTCGSCDERREAFTLNDAIDPMVYLEAQRAQ